MIYTVTLNPAVDKTAVVENLTPGAVNRVSSVREDPGGKGINVSKCLQNLGADSVAAVILAGETGRQLEAMLQALKLPVLSIWAEGNSRTNLKIIDPVSGENTDINEPGPAVTTEVLEALKQAIGQKLQPGDLVILSGSLPAGADKGLYGEWIRYFKKMGAKVFLDADGAPMSEGIRAVPCMIKPNDRELARLMGKDSLSHREMLEAGRNLLQSGIEEVIISLGGDGALFLSQDGIYRAEGLPVTVKSTVGAGDSMVAAMAYGKNQKLPWQTQLRLAVAMGAASVMQSGTQPPEADLVWELAQQVSLSKL